MRTKQVFTSDRRNRDLDEAKLTARILFTLDGKDGPERARDSYGIDGVAFAGFRVFYALQVQSRGASELIEIHP